MTKSKNVLEVSDLDFDAEVLGADLPVLVDFAATWCGPCKMLAPIIEAIADENVGRFKIAKVDMDTSPNLVRRYRVSAAPTLLVFRGGEKRAQRVGVTTKRVLLEMLEAT
jgi:thioredoxin 1